MAVSASKWGNELKILLPTFVKRSGYSHQTKCITRGTTIARVRRDSLPHSFGKKKGRVMADDQEILTVKEICELLRVHPTTLYKMARQGKIPSIRVGTEWRFGKDVILRWMAEKSAHARQVRAVANLRINGRMSTSTDGGLSRT
jgi:excisionase family DNA binding protein